MKTKKIGNDYEYEYIDGAPHGEENRKNDLSKPDTDTLIVGSSNSLILGKYGYTINERILSMIKKDTKSKRKKIDVNAPLGRMYNSKLKKRVASSYPKPAIVDLSQSDIKFLKSIVSSTRGQIKISKNSHQQSTDGGC